MVSAAAIALLNGYMIMLGSLGAVSATAPAEAILGWIGWRGLFEALAVVTAATSILIFLVVPERSKEPQRRRSTDLTTIYSDVRFWRIASLSATCIGSAWALQSLWAAPWLRDVERLERADLVNQLLLMAIVLSIAAMVLGLLGNWLRSRGKQTETAFGSIGAILIVAELMLILHPPWPSLLPWCIVSMAGSATALTYAMIGDYFPIELIARANGALNVLQFGWAFIVQYGVGVILDQWPLEAGHYPLAAYQAAFGANLLLQLASLAWFVIPWRKDRKDSEDPAVTHPIASGTVEGIPPAELVILEADGHQDW